MPCAAGRITLVWAPVANAAYEHRWEPSCGCGWRGEPKHFRGYASNQLRDHLEGASATPAETRAAAQEAGGQAA